MYWKGSVGAELELLLLPVVVLEVVVVVPDDPIGWGGTIERMSFSNLLKTARTSRISLKSSWAAVVIRRYRSMAEAMARTSNRLKPTASSTSSKVKARRAPATRGVCRAVRYFVAS